MGDFHAQQRSNLMAMDIRIHYKPSGYMCLIQNDWVSSPNDVVHNRIRGSVEFLVWFIGECFNVPLIIRFCYHPVFKIFCQNQNAALSPGIFHHQ